MTYFAKAVATVIFSISMVACSSTQKTMGQGMTSVVAQNVVRIAAVQGLKTLSLKQVENEKVKMRLTGFVDDRNQGIIDLLFANRIEEAGGNLVPNDTERVFELEVAVLSAGNDSGSSRGFFVDSERSEGVVDLQVTLRNTNGDVMLRERVFGEAKYEQTEFIIGRDRGRYKVREANGKWKDVPDPSVFR